MAATRIDQIFKDIVETIREPLLVLDSDLKVIIANQNFYDSFKVMPEETVGQLIYDLGNKQWDIPKLRELLETILPEKTSFDNYEVKHDFATIGRRVMLLNARQIKQAMGKERIILLAIEDITERKRLEDSLADSEERYRRLFETANDGILLLEKSELKIRFANPAIMEMLGYSKEELIGKGFKDIGFADNIGNFQEVMQELNKGGIIHYSDASIQNKTGQVVDTDIYMVDKTSLVQCNIRNITERKRAEKDLHESDQKYKFLIENTNDIIWTFDLATKSYSFISTSVERILGYRTDEVVGMTLDDVFSPETKKQIMDSFRRVVRGDDPSGLILMEAEHKAKNDHPVWMEINAVLQRDELGNPVAFNGITRDITERRAVEEALRQNEKQYRSLFNSIRDAILVANTNRMIIDCNPACRELFGYSREELLGKQTLAIYENEKEYEAMGRAIKDHIGDPEFLFPVNYKKADGSVFTGETTVFYLRDDDGAIVGLIGLIRDVSKSKRAEEDREKLQAQLTQALKMESVGRLAGGLAHDYNNMLSVILGYTELSLEKLAPDNPMRHDLQEILAATRRSADITRQLLAFSRQQPISPKALDLNETVESMLKMLRRLIGEDIDLSWHPGARSSTVNMDPTQLDQVLVNLCVNARDAIDDVGKISIETDTRRFDEDDCADIPGCVSGDFVLLSVSDDGCGMDPETLEKIFEPFFTTKQIGKGTGLGLATVYGIVKQNNGFINVYSEPGRGTTFRIYLARHEGAREQALKKDKLAPDARGNETLLLVEDEPTILRMTTMMLQRLGYRVLTAGNPKQAIALTKEHTDKIHLLITDVVMPDMNGRELSVRLHEIHPEIGVLFMSGYTADVIAHRGVLEKGVNFIQKPFSKKDLAVKVREVLDEYGE